MYSEKALDLIKYWEQLRLEAYLPTPDDVWTIGYGHTKGVKEGDVITEEQADCYLKEDTDRACNGLLPLIKVALTQGQLDVIVSLVFNVGLGSFSRSRALKALNRHDLEEFKKQAFSKEHGWVKQNGKVLKGLVRRRQRELELFEASEI